MDRREFLRVSTVLTAGTAVCMEFPAFARTVKAICSATLNSGSLKTLSEK